MFPLSQAIVSEMKISKLLSLYIINQLVEHFVYI